MQSRLPDINTSFNTYRTRAIMAIDSKKHTVCIGALYALNGLLPPEYRIDIDDDLYHEKTRTNIFAVCSNKHCNNETDYNLIKISTISVSPAQSLLTGRKEERIWKCPKCKTQNVLHKTKMIKTTLKEPYFLKVVPSPPQRQDGILDRKSFNRSFERWAWTLLDELEERMAQYRDDNWERGGGEMDTGTEIESNLEEDIVI